MALTLDPSTKIISVPQSYLTLVSGTLYSLDTDQFRKDVWDLLSSEPYIWLPVPFIHNTAVTVAGTTFARTIEFINGYSVEFEDAQYSVRLEGSNNNIFDVGNGILQQNQVQVISTNSAGLIQASQMETDIETVRDILEGDQIHDADDDTFEIQHKTSKEVLVKKNVTGGDAVTQDIQLTEP